MGKQTLMFNGTDHPNLKFCQKTTNRLYYFKDFWRYNESDSDWDNIHNEIARLGTSKYKYKKEETENDVQAQRVQRTTTERDECDM